MTSHAVDRWIWNGAAQFNDSMLWGIDRNFILLSMLEVVTWVTTTAPSKDYSVIFNDSIYKNRRPPDLSKDEHHKLLMRMYHILYYSFERNILTGSDVMAVFGMLTRNSSIMAHFTKVRQVYDKGGWGTGGSRAGTVPVPWKVLEDLIVAAGGTRES